MHISGIRPCVVFYEHSINKNQDKENHQVMQLTASDSTYKRKVLDGELANLDVEWAINSMKKDQVIHQYQFFVGGELSL